MVAQADEAEIDNNPAAPEGGTALFFDGWSKFKSKKTHKDVEGCEVLTLTEDGGMIATISQ